MAKEKKTKRRSPTYPIIGLQEALKRVGDLYRKEGKNFIAREIAVTSIGYKSLSGRALQVLSSLFQYKLLDRTKGKVRISEGAFTILNAPENSVDKNQALKCAALAPTVFQDIKDEYPRTLPSDETVKWFLQQRQFSIKAAETLIQSFRETISFAKVYEIDYSVGEEQDNTAQESQESPMNTNLQNVKKKALGPIIWTFPFGEKTASLSIDGGKPKQEEMGLLINILNAFKETLPKKAEKEENE